jgi:hypothetical protein
VNPKTSATILGNSLIIFRNNLEIFIHESVDIPLEKDINGKRNGNLEKKFNIIEEEID